MPEGRGRRQGHEVHLANLTFTPLSATTAKKVDPVTRQITPTSEGSSYFPEQYLSEWLSGRDQPSDVYAFEASGVLPLRSAYQTLVNTLGVDAIVLIDGGTDALLRRLLRRLVQERRIPFSRAGRCIVIAEADIEAYLERNRVEPPRWEAAS